MTSHDYQLSKDGQTINLLTANIKEIFNKTVLKDKSPDTVSPITIAIDNVL